MSFIRKYEAFRKLIDFECTFDEEATVNAQEVIGKCARLIGCMDNAEVQPAPQWISIKEKLPEIGKSVLIHYPKWDGDEIQVAKLEADGMMFDICGEFNIGIGAVTHWMPLPEPPKDGEI